MKEQGFSSIHLPVTLSKQDIETTINRLITGVVYEDKSMDKDDLMVKAEKSELISVEIDSNTFRYRVPLDIWVKKDIGLTEVEAKGAIALEFQSTYEIKEDWQMKTRTSIVNYEWLIKPKVTFGFWDISIKFIADKVIERSKNIIGQSLDRQLAQGFNLRSYILKGWEVLQQPILVSKEYDLWVKIQPELLSITPLEVSDGIISGKVLMEARTNAFVGEKPGFDDGISLPPFKYSDSESNHFVIRLATSVSCEKAEDLAKKLMVGKTYTSSGRSVTVEDIAIDGQEDKLVVDAQVTGSYTGSIHMIGRPYYNAKEKQIEFEGLEFELKTRNILMQGLGWLFRKNLERQFKKALKFPMEEKLVEAKELVESKLKNYKITEQIMLNGELEDIEIHKTVVRAAYIDVLMSVSGKLNVSIGAGDGEKL